MAQEVIDRAGRFVSIEAMHSSSDGGAAAAQFPPGASHAFTADHSSRCFDTSLYDAGALKFDRGRSTHCPVVIHLQSIAAGGADLSGGDGGMPQSQTIFATLTPPAEEGGAHGIKVVTVKVQVDGQNLEMQELYGLSDGADAAGGDGGLEAEAAECVICLCEPPDTAIFPCRSVVWEGFKCALGVAQRRANIHSGARKLLGWQSCDVVTWSHCVRYFSVSGFAMQCMREGIAVVRCTVIRRTRVQNVWFGVLRGTHISFSLLYHCIVLYSWSLLLSCQGICVSARIAHKHCECSKITRALFVVTVSLPDAMSANALLRKRVCGASTLICRVSFCYSPPMMCIE